jgi:hypothetical protein
VRVQGQHRFSASRELVWRALMDPRVLARTLPGCDTLEATGEHRFRGTMNLQIGPVQGTFAGTVDLSDLDPGRCFRVSVHGEGPSGFVEASGPVLLEGSGADTSIAYDLEATVGGRLAGVGQRLLDSTARAVTRQALDGLARQIDAMKAAEGSAVPAPVPAGPTPGRFAAGVARDVAGDLVPGGRRSWLLVIGIGALAAVAAWLAW